MGKNLRSFLVGIALVGAISTRAYAIDWAGNGTYCGGDNFSTCVSINLSWTNGSGTSTVATLVLRDLTGEAGLKWFTVGLDNMPAGLTYSGSGDLSFASDFNSGHSGPFPDTKYVMGESGGSVTTVNTPYTFTFNFSSGVSQNWTDILNAAGVGLHAGGTACGSTKLHVIKDGSTYQANDPAEASDCDFDPPTSVPEPATMGLLALGLVGMGGAGLLRRRRKV